MPAIKLTLLPLFGLLCILCISKPVVCNNVMLTASSFAKMLHFTVAMKSMQTGPLHASDAWWQLAQGSSEQHK
jgi:hypothetical protein